MKNLDIIIAHPGSEDKFEALKAFMKALKIKFEVPADNKPYNPDFVNKIIESRLQAKKGKVTRINKNNLNDFLGL
jgi:hypothetical protein